MEVHAIVLWTRLVFHEVTAVLGGAERGLKGPAVDEDVVDGGNGAQRILGLVVGDVRAGAGPLVLVARVRRAVVDDDLVDLAELSKILRFSEDVGLGQPRGEPHHEHQVALHHAHVGQMLPEGTTAATASV